MTGKCFDQQGQDSLGEIVSTLTLMSLLSLTRGKDPQKYKWQWVISEEKLGAQALAERWRHPSNVPPLTSQFPAREHGGAGWRWMANGAERADPTPRQSARARS